MKLTDKEIEILKYTKPHIKHMWAATIASIIFDCDFRDVEHYYEKYGV